MFTCFCYSGLPHSHQNILLKASSSFFFFFNILGFFSNLELKTLPPKSLWYRPMKSHNQALALQFCSWYQYSDVSYCYGKIPEENQIKEEGFRLAHCFKGYTLHRSRKTGRRVRRLFTLSLQSGIRKENEC